jgi:FkbM family methyltransferase
VAILTYPAKLLSKASERLGKVLLNFSKQLYKPPQEKRVLPWIKDRGDKTFRLNYDLDENSLVFDLGGYEGQWASDIFSRYCCTIHVFEPVSEFADKIKARFAGNKKVLVHQFGLANENRAVLLSVNKTSSSLYKQGGELKEVRLVKAVDFIQENHIQKIDLMKINIEGAEYDLLEHLIDAGLIGNINNIQVQFHDFVANAEQRMTMLQNKLAKTHHLTYQYPFVWENWRVK